MPPRHVSMFSCFFFSVPLFLSCPTQIYNPHRHSSWIQPSVELSLAFKDILEVRGKKQAMTWLSSWWHKLVWFFLCSFAFLREKGGDDEDGGWGKTASIPCGKWINTQTFVLFCIALSSPSLLVIGFYLLLDMFAAKTECGILIQKLQEMVMLSSKLAIIETSN